MPDTYEDELLGKLADAAADVAYFARTLRSYVTRGSDDYTKIAATRRQLWQAHSDLQRHYATHDRLYGDYTC